MKTFGRAQGMCGRVRRDRQTGGRRRGLVFELVFIGRGFDGEGRQDRRVVPFAQVVLQTFESRERRVRRSHIERHADLQEVPKSLRRDAGRVQATRLFRRADGRFRERVELRMNGFAQLCDQRRASLCDIPGESLVDLVSVGIQCSASLLHSLGSLSIQMFDHRCSDDRRRAHPAGRSKQNVGISNGPESIADQGDAIRKRLEVSTFHQWLNQVDHDGQSTCGNASAFHVLGLRFAGDPLDVVADRLCLLLSPIEESICF